MAIHLWRITSEPIPFAMGDWVRMDVTSSL